MSYNSIKEAKEVDIDLLTRELKRICVGKSYRAVGRDTGLSYELIRKVAMGTHKTVCIDVYNKLLAYCKAN